MPLRVRCRCGQELTVRYSEWVYVFLGAALLALVLNAIALVLLYFRIDGLSRLSASPPAVHEPAPLADVSSRPPEKAPPAPTAATRTAAEAEPRESTPAARAGNEPARAETKGLAPPALPTPPAPPTLEPSALPVDRSLQQALESVEPKATTRRQPPAPLIDGGALVRLFLLESSAGDSAARVAAALLHDEDPRLERRAIERLLHLRQDRDAAIKLMGSPEIAALVNARAARLQATPGGRELLDLVKATPASPGEPNSNRAARDASDLAAILLKIRGECSSWLLRDDARALARHVESTLARGVDVLLVVDVSQSMAGALEALQKDAFWLLPALTWVLPGARVGALFYRDGVEGAVDFSLAPEEEVLRTLRECRAEGGGDVPEGVHVALEAALSLGRFHWREDASKIVVIVGDAPPPLGSKAGLLALTRQARLQSHFQVHALGVNVEEGRGSVPMFPEIAGAGGGLSVTVTDLSQIGVETLLCVVAPEARATLRSILPALKSLFHADVP